MDNGTYDETSTRIEYKRLHALERIREAARDMANVIKKFDDDRMSNIHLAANLSAKTRKCIKTDLFDKFVGL